MKRLYKKGKDDLEFQHAFREGDDEVTIIWGTVGKWGQSETYLIDGEYLAEPAIENVLADANSRGFEEIRVEEHQSVWVKWKVDDPGARAAGLKASEIHQILGNELGWTGNGACEDVAIVGGSIRAACLVVNLPTALRSIENALKTNNLWEGAEIHTDDPDAQAQD